MDNLHDNKDVEQFGKKIRELRKSKEITLNELAKKTGLTASFISQFERGLKTASVSSMKKITQVLNTSLVHLFEESESKNREMNEVSLVRKDDRKKIVYPAPASTKDYSLTDINGKLQVIYSTIEPGGNSGDLYSHESEEECVIVLSGTMRLSVENKTYILYKGDTIKYSSRSQHGWENIGEDKLETLWIITPPSF